MDKYGLLGHTLTHSFSRGYFNDKFKAENINAEYINFELASIDEFKDVIKLNPQLKGLNVTIPYKEQIIPYLDGLSDNAKEIGAVNVIKFVRKGNNLKLIGHNSDIRGFKQSIEPLLEPHQRHALILGTGGASKAVAVGLKQLGIESSFVSRTPRIGQLGYKHLSPGLMGKYMLIVNCTPVGMYPHVNEAPELPYEWLGNQHLLYDLLYNPEETLFLKKGKEMGSTVKNGLEMLLLQAFESWNIWQAE